MIVQDIVDDVVIEIGKDNFRHCKLSVVNAPDKYVEFYAQSWQELKQKIDRMFDIVQP